MAETTTFGTQRDLTVTIKDDTGTPKTYTFRIGPEGVEMKRAQFASVRAQDTDSSYIGVPRRGPLTESAMIRLQNLRIYDTGENTTEAVLADFVPIDASATGGSTTAGGGGTAGYVSSTWVNQAGTGSPDFKLFDLTVAMADYGALKGGTWTASDVWIDNQPTHKITPEGHFIDEIVFRMNADPAFVRNS
jgi:hypothetical protein